MKNEMFFLWIADEKGIEETATFLEKNFGVQIHLIQLNGKNLQDGIKAIQDSDNPDLILMDHSLEKMKNTFVTNGSALTEILHVNWSKCPIVCVTEVNIDTEILVPEKTIYDGIFRVSELSEKFKTIITIAESFQSLKKQKLKNINDLIKILQAPKDDYIRLKAILPADLTKHLEDKRLSSTICKWVRNILLKKPGFLYDRLWAATLFGIKEESFSKVEGIFKDALYNGIFADESHPHWWQSKLREILYSTIQESELRFPWILGRNLPQIDKIDYNKCYVCNKNYPEIVAYTDEKNKNRAPMHLRCTVTHPNAEQSLFFEEVRIMKGDE